MRLTLDPYRPGHDDAEVLDLRARVWGADHPHTDAAFLTWLFRDNPAGEGGGVLLRRGGILIGFAGLCPDIETIHSGQTGVRGYVRRRIEDAVREHADSEHYVDRLAPRSRCKPLVYHDAA